MWWVTGSLKSRGTPEASRRGICGMLICVQGPEGQDPGCGSPRACHGNIEEWVHVSSPSWAACPALWLVLARGQEKSKAARTRCIGSFMPKLHHAECFWTLIQCSRNSLYYPLLIPNIQFHSQKRVKTTMSSVCTHESFPVSNSLSGP